MSTILLETDASASGACAYPCWSESLPRAVIDEGKYLVRFAETPEELDAVLRLRFAVFNLELEEGLESSFATGRDQDDLDLSCHHLLVVHKNSGEIVGTYRLMMGEMAAAKGFYSAGEFDLSGLTEGVLADAVEIGRACIARPHRNTQVLFLLWKGLAAYVAHNRKRYLFGCCSLTSQDQQEGWRALQHLKREGYLHPTLTTPPLPGFECAPDASAEGETKEFKLPRLFHTYLRFGAKVCSPPAIDRAFKTIDFLVCFDVYGLDRKTQQLFFGA